MNQMSEPAVPLVLSRITIVTARLQKGKTNLSHDGLNPAHVPYWWVNNPTLGEFCFAMIGRADIEGSKSNVAMNAWLPQASYPCGTLSPATGIGCTASRLAVLTSGTPLGFGPSRKGFGQGSPFGGGGLYLRPPLKCLFVFLLWCLSFFLSLNLPLSGKNRSGAWRRITHWCIPTRCYHTRCHEAATTGLAPVAW